MTEAPATAWDARQVVGSRVPTDEPPATLTAEVHRSRVTTAWFGALSAIWLDVVMVAWAAIRPASTGVVTSAATAGYEDFAALRAVREAVNDELAYVVLGAALIASVAYRFVGRPIFQRGDVLRGDALAAMVAIIACGIGGQVWAEDRWRLTVWLGDDRWVLIPALAATVVVVRWSLLLLGVIASLATVEAVHGWVARRRRTLAGA